MSNKFNGVFLVFLSVSGVVISQILLYRILIFRSYVHKQI
nr:MAG TPA: hypothetical protein [Caudoviricetes sp.]